jgi:hypothetical protein
LGILRADGFETELLRLRAHKSLLIQQHRVSKDVSVEDGQEKEVGGGLRLKTKFRF